MPKPSHRRRSFRSSTHAAQRITNTEMNESDAYQHIQSLDEPFILVIDGVQDPHNLGACLRSADAAGVDLVFAPQKGTTGITETVRNIACGGADHIPYVQVGNLNRVLEKLKELDINMVGTGDAASQLLYDVPLTGNLVMVMGSEARGLRPKIAEKCDFLVRIPMLGHVDCLNLSVATGICLYEAVRQRNGRS